VSVLATRNCSCTQEVALGQRRPPTCEHGNRYLTEAQLNPKPRKPLKQGRGMAASRVQQLKVRNLPCIVCGRDRHEAEIQAAHVWPRAYTPCECVDGVVSLCAEHHAQYDAPDHPLDLLTYLVRGYRVEFCHAFVAHDIPISELLRRVTGTPWRPLAKPEREVANDRLFR